MFLRRKNICLHFFHWIATLLVVFAFSACSVTKYTPEGDLLYQKGALNIENDTFPINNKAGLKTNLESLIRPVPNKKFMGLYVKLWFYHAAGTPKSENGLRNWMKTKIGEPPVYISMVNPDLNMGIIKNTLENNGYFNAQVTYDTVYGKKFGKVNYTARPGPSYTIRNVSFPGDSIVAVKTINAIKESSLLKTGEAYNFEKIKAERNRIDNNLKETGFYLFSPDYLLMKVDSTVGTHEVDIQVVLKRETPDIAMKQWYIKNIYIYPDYEPAADSIKIDSQFYYKNYYIIDPLKKYKPIVFDRTIFFKPGQLYDKTDHNKTLSRLVNVGTFRFVKNRFEELPGLSDSAFLNTYYYLISSKKRNIRLETTAKTTSANFGGFELNMNWKNKNAFRGAEQLSVKIFGGVDVQFGGQNKGYNIYRYGTEFGLRWPRFILFNVSPKSSFVPQTRTTIGYEWQQRQKLYTLNTLKGDFGWAWKQNLRSEHDINPFNFTYVNSSNVSQEYLDQIALDSSLARVIEEQMIVGPTYTYIFNNTVDPNRKNSFFYKGNYDFSGNILGLIQGANAKQDNIKTLLGVQYSQFFKTEQEFKFYRKFNPTKINKQWVSRIDIGVGIPYGNSLQLPFIKQFFTGGSNNLRAFRVRSVGPGSYKPSAPSGSFLPDLVGDIKLEMNTEYRTKLFGPVLGAVFIDAGNVWLFNESDSKPGGKFSSKFLSELAVGTGAGLRFDIVGIFVIRIDTGLPLRKPWLPENERWVLKDINLGSSTWRKDNLILNLAVGMPF